VEERIEQQKENSEKLQDVGETGILYLNRSICKESHCLTWKLNIARGLKSEASLTLNLQKDGSKVLPENA